MDVAAVLGPAGGDTARLAERVADALKAKVQQPGEAVPAGDVVVVAHAPGDVPDDARLVVFLDSTATGREESLEFLAAALAAGRSVEMVETIAAGRRLLNELKYEGWRRRAPGIRRLFLAAGGHEDSQRFAGLLSTRLGLPFVEADSPEKEGWGPRYARLAAPERWLVHSSDWHAVETFAEAADLVVYLDTAAKKAAPAGFETPTPESRTWRTVFGPWWKRYPRVEANLLQREVAHWAHLAPVFRLRTAGEIEAFTRGIVSSDIKQA